MSCLQLLVCITMTHSANDWTRSVNTCMSCRCCIKNTHPVSTIRRSWCVCWPLTWCSMGTNQHGMTSDVLTAFHACSELLLCQHRSGRNVIICVRVSWGWDMSAFLFILGLRCCINIPLRQNKSHYVARGLCFMMWSLSLSLSSSLSAFCWCSCLNFCWIYRFTFYTVEYISCNLSKANYIYLIYLWIYVCWHVRINFYFQ